MLAVKGLKKGDIAVIAVALVLLILSIGLTFLIRKDGKTVRVYEDNKLKYEGSLLIDKTVELSHNTVKIKDGKAYMESSSCKNKICINTGKISNSGESVVCLPNKVIIEIE